MGCVRHDRFLDLLQWKSPCAGSEVDRGSAEQRAWLRICSLPRNVHVLHGLEVSGDSTRNECTKPDHRPKHTKARSHIKTRPEEYGPWNSRARYQPGDMDTAAMLKGMVSAFGL